MNVIHLPTSVGGNSYALARAERQLGINSVSLNVWKNFWNYPADIVLDSDNFFAKMNMLLKLKKEYQIFHF